jgi:hypothetical protein
MLAEGQMRRFYQAIMACGLPLLLGACAQTTALEPQDQILDSSLSRIYFFRQSQTPTDLSRFSAAEIKVDGKSIGSLAPGTSVYIVADRPEGPHKITVHRPGDSAGFDADVQIEPTTSHYFEVGPTVEANIDQARLNAMGMKGHPTPGHFAASTPFMFYTLDPIAGAGMITRLKSKEADRVWVAPCEDSKTGPSPFPRC